MNPSVGDQMDLLGRSEPEPVKRSGSTRLGILISQQNWLHFLASEWLSPGENGQILLGAGCIVAGDLEPEEPSIAVWFDVSHLPKVTVRAYSDGKWEGSHLGSLPGGHCAVAWNGPLPLFAVDHFGVATEQLRRHLMALTQGFRDLEPPKQPVIVEEQSELTEVGPNDHPVLTGTMHPPANWNSLRGAAAMAAWAVPAIDPWLTLLCESLQDNKPNEAADAVHAKWWRTALWTCHANSVSDDPLWTAILNELGTVRAAKQLLPRQSLNAICERAGTLGVDQERLENLKTATQRLLDDQTTIQKAGLIDDVLALSLQLLLLRPVPDRFVGWREDWPAVPPGAWWTGATLCGFLNGFKSLPVEYRGTPEARKQLALRTWKLGCGGNTELWDDVTSETLDWARVGDLMHLRSDGKVWAEHKISRRGRWYQLDFEDKAVREALEPLVMKGHGAQGGLMTSHLVLREGSFAFSTKSDKGSVSVKKTDKAIVIKGDIEIELGANAYIEKRFSVDRVKDWLATASISEALPRPDFPALNLTDLNRRNSESPLEGAQVATSSIDAPAKKAKGATAPKAKKVGGTPVGAPPGLTLIQDFINDDEEQLLLDTIDSQPWDDKSMARKVQHYGWKYDYQGRKVDPSSRIGPLPAWLEVLAKRLVDLGVCPEMPDQVLVNNYVGSQGISKHVDCVPCFRGPVVMLSLNEAWEMVFSRKVSEGEDSKYGLVLPRRSATVLEGEARLNWLHEIPKRKNEGKMPRVRRVSVTFRKVAI